MKWLLQWTLWRIGYAIGFRGAPKVTFPLTPLTEACTKPGDPDLDIDLDCVIVEAVVVNKPDLMLTFKNGFGLWNSNGQMAKVEDAHGTLSMKFLTSSDNLFDYMVNQLAEWRLNGTPLRLVGAPNKPFLLIEDQEKWLPLPRRPFPGD